MDFLISLAFVRMCLKPVGPNMLASAQSTRYAPSINYDGTLLHGAYVILSTSNSWSD